MSFASLTRARARTQAELEELVASHMSSADAACNDAWRRKLGLSSWRDGEEGDAQLLAGLLRLMTLTKADYTLVWRQLAVVPDQVGLGSGRKSKGR